MGLELILAIVGAISVGSIAGIAALVLIRHNR
jgi:hypothetical protein